jgi:hypothetical protein
MLIFDPSVPVKDIVRVVAAAATDLRLADPRFFCPVDETLLLPSGIGPHPGLRWLLGVTIDLL